MQIILSHAGKQHSYHVAKALHEQGLLETFYTSSYLKNKHLQDYFLRNNNTFWTRRFIDGLHGKVVNSNWRFEVNEFLVRRFFGKSERFQNAVYERDVIFDNYVAKQLPKKNFNIFWGFQGSCYESLKTAKQGNKLTICELATAHVTEAKRILTEESKLHPEWADSIDNLVFPPQYEKRLQQEPHIADFALAASKFTVQSLLNDNVPQEKILYLPLGFDLQHIPFIEKPQNIENRPIKLLYAGTVTQRKGIKYLLEAMKQINSKDIELHIVGNIHGSGKAMENYAGLYQHHSPVSQHELFAKYADFDALVLPTVFEGFGLVIVEAMAAGLPVITTSHSIGPDLIENDKNGYIVPIRDVLALQNAIEKMRQKTNAQMQAMRSAARESATLYSWDAYATRLQNLLKIFP